MGVFINSIIATGAWVLFERNQIIYPETITISGDETFRYQIYGIVFVSALFIGRMVLGLLNEVIMATLHSVAIDMELHKSVP